MPGSLKIQDLDVRLGGALVLDCASLEIPAGSLFGLIGRNGAGKTTLLRSIMGLVTPSSGSVLLSSTDLSEMPAYERAALRIGYMPEDRRLVPNLTVEDNVLLPYWAGRLPDATGRFVEVCELIPELVPLRERKANQLSGGQQKLVALGRAFAIGHSILLLDEPLEGVAPALAFRLTEILTDLRSRGITILVTESERKHIEKLIDGAFLIERGRVQERK